MKRKQVKFFGIGVSLLAAFALWTVLVSTVDVRPIGPGASEVGFAALNGFFHKLTGVHMWLYTVTDWLGLVPVAVALGFAVWGLWQWGARKFPWRVDRSILALGAFYLVVAAVYLLFKTVVVNPAPC